MSRSDEVVRSLVVVVAVVVVVVADLGLAGPRTGREGGGKKWEKVSEQEKQSGWYAGRVVEVVLTEPAVAVAAAAAAAATITTTTKKNPFPKRVSE